MGLVIVQTKPTVLLTSSRVDYLNTKQNSEQEDGILDSKAAYIMTYGLKPLQVLIDTFLINSTYDRPKNSVIQQLRISWPHGKLQLCMNSVSNSWFLIAG